MQYIYTVGFNTKVIFNIFKNTGFNKTSVYVLKNTALSFKKTKTNVYDND